MTEKDLLEAVQLGRLDEVRAALQQNLDPNYSDSEDGYTLLHWAAQEGFLKIINLLVQFGADVNACSHDDMTALYNAAGDGNLEVVKTLVSCGANVNNSPRIGSALHNASAHGNTDVVEFLIANGADVNAVDEEGQSPLVFATSRGHADVVALLTAHGGRKYVTDAEGLSVSLKVANATLARYEKVGFESLGKAEQILAGVLALKFEVENQGFDSYYSNPSGNHAGETVHALEHIGAIHTAELTRQANALFKNGTPPKEQDARVNELARSRKARKSLDDLTHAFYRDRDNLRELLSDFIKKNSAQLPSP